MVNSYRTFIAIELPSDLRARIIEHIDHLRREVPDVRASWLREDNLHLTLKFLGDVPVPRIGELSDAVERAARDVCRLELIVSGCGTFPPRGRPSVLWLGIQERSGTEVSNLQTLHSAIENACFSMGFPRELRAFHPHLTIARLRKQQGAHQLADLHKRLGFPAQSFIASEVVVFRSELLSEGSRHTAISGHKLWQPTPKV